MDDETTTQEPVDTGAQAQPEEAVQPSAEPEDSTVPQQQEQPTETEQPERDQTDTELQSWAEKKGLQLDSENATKAAKMAREAERAMHEKAQRASELERSMTGISDQVAENVAEQTNQDPEVLKRLQRMEVKESVRDFWNTPLPTGETPDRQLEQAMITELQAKPQLAGDLESLYAVALYKNGSSVKSQGGRQALENLAHKQQAAVPTGHATNPSATPAKKKFEDMSLKEMEAYLGTVRQ